ncbi:MAG: gliding motility-associated protein GldE [Bacteroidia bacterium]
MVSDDPYPSIYLQINNIFSPELGNLSIAYLYGTIILLIVLIFLSGLFSASENALFSLSEKNKEDIREQDSSAGNTVLKLLSQPRKLLATILVGNNFINVSFVIISSVWLETILNSDMNPYVDFAIKVIFVTLILLLFGEVVPKVYATKRNVQLSKFMAYPLLICQRLFAFLVYPMVHFTSIIDKKVRIHEHTVSADELTHAIDITSDTDTGQQEKEILKGIVSFGSKTVRQIMKSRVDVAALDISISFEEMLAKVNSLGYSRLPAYDDTFDNIAGVLYIKELLPHLYEKPDFEWKSLLKPAFFVPDHKRIDLLLAEFQESRMHMAIVVDEYGGKLGIVTMEDILEEIFGEINDEFDEEPLNYSKLDDNKYIIEGKMLINDFCKIAELEDDDIFDAVKEDSETMAGMLMEMYGKIPGRNETIKYKQFSFTIESVDNRRIKRIKVEIHAE